MIVVESSIGKRRFADTISLEEERARFSVSSRNTLTMYLPKSIDNSRSFSVSLLYPFFSFFSFFSFSF